MGKKELQGSGKRQRACKALWAMARLNGNRICEKAGGMLEKIRRPCNNMMYKMRVFWTDIMDTAA